MNKKEICIGIFVLVAVFLSFLYITRNKTEEIPLLAYSRDLIYSQKDSSLPGVTIESIFANDHSWTATLSAEKKQVIVATGDVIPARVVNIQATRKNNFKWPFEKTAHVVQDGDITFINLETPLLKKCPLNNEGFTFCGNSNHIEGLLLAGVDVASLANNHAANYGEDGVIETTQLLEKNGVTVMGINGPAYKKVQGKTFAFLGYNDIGGKQPGVSQAEELLIKEDIQKARSNADVVIVTYHWGEEYRSQPDERQIYLGRFTIDSGADVVIGNHPHWIQPVEVYKGKLITYAHGNYIFDQEWSLNTKQGVIGRYTFYDGKLVDVEYLPIQIEEYGQPYFLEGEKKKTVLDEMKKQSKILANPQ